MGLIATTSKEDKVFDVPFVVVEIKVPLHHAILINTKYCLSKLTAKIVLEDP